VVLGRHNVAHAFSGLTNLIFPNGQMTKEDARLVLRLGLELRLRASRQTPTISPDEFPLTSFSYRDRETGDSEVVAIEV
jgi:ATP-dependent Lon protease